MEAKFKSLSIFEFQEKFPDTESCYLYLEKLKWGNGFKCLKCGYAKACKAHRPFERQCNSCHTTVSVTSGTLFQGLKFSLLKAFYIVYYVSTSKKGVASTALSRKLELRQKTAWFFKQKVMNAMKSSNNFMMEGTVEVDETVVGQQEEGVVGRKNKHKKLVVFAIEKKDKGVSRMYGKVIEKASSKELGGFMRQKIAKDADIKTDEWTGYKPLVTEFTNLKRVKSGKKGENFPDLHRVIMGFKGWLRGIHHHVDHLQAYIDEYCYRFNRNKMKEGIFENLITRMVNAKPYPYKLMSLSNA
jgi:ISXO2-like transposase domain/Transposase zinc-ribbon domain